MWPVKDYFELIRNNGKQNTRNSARAEHKEESINWQKNTNAQFGYGEITRVSNIYNLALDKCNFRSTNVKYRAPLQIS